MVHVDRRMSNPRLSTDIYYNSIHKSIRKIMHRKNKGDYAIAVTLFDPYNNHGLNTTRPINTSVVKLHCNPAYRLSEYLEYIS